MAKKTTITLDTKLRNNLCSMKNDYDLRSIEDVIRALFETKDDAKIKIYVDVAVKNNEIDAKKEEAVLRKELIEIYNFDLDVVNMLDFKEVKTAIKSCKKDLAKN